MLDIKILGEEVLKKHSSLVPKVDRPVQDLIQAMFETMYEGKGVGLAAPQVGESKRLFVCHATDDKPRVFINPEIIATSEEQVIFEEGCLSIPNVYCDVLRPAWITVQARDENGKIFTLDARGYLARVIQHEIDHLNGMLFIDRINEKKRQRIMKNFKKTIKV